MNASSVERYRLAKTIAEELLALHPSERAARLAARCDEDPALRREVEWLLAAAEDSSADDLPERFHSAARDTLRAVSLEVPMPRNYQLLERLDAGGSGVVYKAERVDGAAIQIVALKLLSPAQAGDHALAERFANERQALARLNHPNIAHLIDGGLTAEGRPFLATEYVEGQPIDQWCTDRRAPLATRLNLLIKVCEAVDYAHRHMVIHRDLKPSNVLVTADGEPKLLDFGIARLLDQNGQDACTGDGDFMTLAYASPEQLAGRPLSAATDVYSVGVILHELLYGQRPFEHITDRQARLAQLQDPRPPALADTEQPTPSLPIKRIPTDLKAIVHKALAADTERRYASARELAQDFRLCLAGRPVSARKASPLYRLQRFTGRHHLATALTLLGFGLLLAFLVDRENQLQRIAWERDRAEAVTGFMNEIFSGADSLPSRGNAVTVREILDLGSERLGSDDAFNPTVVGAIHLALGRAYNALGLGEQALPRLQTARDELGPYASLAEQARIEAEIAAALDSAGRAAAAIAADERAIALLLRSPDTDGDEILGLRVRKLRNHANVLDVPLDQTTAELDAIASELRSRADPPRELLFEALAALVAAQVFLDRTEEALETASLARQITEELYGEDDPRRLRGRHVYATALMLSDPNQAIARFQSLVADHERLIGPSQRLANSLGNLGVALARAGRTAEAITAFAQAAEMIEQISGRSHYLYRLSQSNRAALHLRQSEPALAEALIRTLLGSAPEDGPPTGVEASYQASAMDILGSALALQGRLREAAEVYRQALALLAAENGPAIQTLKDSLGQRLAAVEAELSG